MGRMRRAAAARARPRETNTARNSTENAIVVRSVPAPPPEVLIGILSPRNKQEMIAGRRAFVVRRVILKQSLDAVGDAFDHVAIVAHVGAARRASRSPTRAGACDSALDIPRRLLPPVSAEAEARALATTPLQRSSAIRRRDRRRLSSPRFPAAHATAPRPTTSSSRGLSRRTGEAQASVPRRALRARRRCRPRPPLPRKQATRASYGVCCSSTPTSSSGAAPTRGSRPSRWRFAATSEKANRGFTGLNTHFVLRPPGASPARPSPRCSCARPNATTCRIPTRENGAGPRSARAARVKSLSASRGAQRAGRSRGAIQWRSGGPDRCAAGWPGARASPVPPHRESPINATEVEAHLEPRVERRPRLLPRARPGGARPARRLDRARARAGRPWTSRAARRSLAARRARPGVARRRARAPSTRTSTTRGSRRRAREHVDPDTPVPRPSLRR